MAAATKTKTMEVEEIIEDFEMDEDDYAADLADETVESKTTNTANFMGGEVEVVDEIEDLGVVVIDPDQEEYIVRVTVDVGPVYYGSELIELKRGHRYRVPKHIHAYLAKRDVLWEQQ